MALGHSFSKFITKISTLTDHKSVEVPPKRPDSPFLMLSSDGDGDSTDDNSFTFHADQNDGSRTDNRALASIDTSPATNRLGCAIEVQHAQSYPADQFGSSDSLAHGAVGSVGGRQAADENKIDSSSSAVNLTQSLLEADLVDSFQNRDVEVNGLDEIRSHRLSPLTREKFQHLFDASGRLVQEHFMRKLIFKGGVEKDIRKDVWKFLFELYPCNSTSSEREILCVENAIRYAAMKSRWKNLLKALENDYEGVRYCPKWYSGCQKNLSEYLAQKSVISTYQDSAEVVPGASAESIVKIDLVDARGECHLESLRATSSSGFLTGGPEESSHLNTPLSEFLVSTDEHGEHTGIVASLGFEDPVHSLANDQEDVRPQAESNTSGEFDVSASERLRYETSDVGGSGHSFSNNSLSYSPTSNVSEVPSGSQINVDNISDALADAMFEDIGGPPRLRNPVENLKMASLCEDLDYSRSHIAFGAIRATNSSLDDSSREAPTPSTSLFSPLPISASARYDNSFELDMAAVNKDDFVEAVHKSRLDVSVNLQESLCSYSENFKSLEVVQFESIEDLQPSLERTSMNMHGNAAIFVNAIGNDPNCSDIETALQEDGEIMQIMFDSVATGTSQSGEKSDSCNESQETERIPAPAHADLADKIDNSRSLSSRLLEQIPESAESTSHLSAGIDQKCTDCSVSSVAGMNNSLLDGSALAREESRVRSISAESAAYGDSVCDAEVESALSSSTARASSPAMGGPSPQVASSPPALSLRLSPPLLEQDEPSAAIPQSSFQELQKLNMDRMPPWIVQMIRASTPPAPRSKRRSQSRAPFSIPSTTRRIDAVDDPASRWSLGFEHDERILNIVESASRYLRQQEGRKGGLAIEFPETDRVKAPEAVVSKNKGAKDESSLPSKSDARQQLVPLLSSIRSKSPFPVETASELKFVTINADSDVRYPVVKDGLSCSYCDFADTEKICLKTSLGADQLRFMEIQAELFAARQPYRTEAVYDSVRMVDKDVPRTDRELPQFRGDSNPGLVMLRDALITYSFFHPDVGYAQGMNDIMSRFLVVMEAEAEAYWMFVRYMEHFHNDFMEDGMLGKITMVEQLLMKMDRPLYDFFQSTDMGLMFCHRWLLLNFKREFEFDEALRLFEITSSRHLEVSSLEAKLERYKERTKEFEKDSTVSRLEEIDSSPEYPFDIFICVAMLIECRELIMGHADISSVYAVLSNLPTRLDLESVLRKSEELFYQYCRKTVVDCFQVIDELEVANFKQGWNLFPSLLPLFTE